MGEKGWIKLHRQLQECPIWYGERFSKGQAWVDLLLLANHRDKKILFNGEMVVIQRGQYLTSMVKLAEKWGWNRKTVSTYLNMLERDNMIARVSDNNKTLITIENYEVYQGYEEESDNSLDNSTDNLLDNRTDSRADNSLDTNKNDKNIKNNIYAQNELCENEQKEDKKTQKEEIENNFKIIYDSYPKKVGKARGFDLYKGWLKGRDISGRKVKLTNKQMWDAIAKYKQQLEKDGTEKQYIKQFDTFMCKAILDYVDEE